MEMGQILSGLLVAVFGFVLGSIQGGLLDIDR